MNELLRDNWPVLLIALGIALILYMLLLRPRQRVELTDSTPMRPHMVQSRDQDSPKEGNDIASEAAAAASDVVGQVIDAPVHDHLVNGPGGTLDDFQKLKGVGPKFAQMLQARGFTRYDQLAGLSGEEMERVDSELGPFRGRLQRDRVIEQAQFLARGDIDGFQQQFGKL